MSLTVILRTNKKPNKKGEYPLALQIIRDGKRTVVHIGQMLNPDHWDGTKVKKTHPNSVRLNNFINKKLSDATDKSLEHTDVSVKVLKNKIKPTAKETFFGQADLYLETLNKAGKYNRYSADKPRIKHFREFAGDIAFSDITVSQLERFRAHLKGTLEMSERSAVNHLVVIRSVFSQAIKDKVVDPKHYPFGKGGVKIKFPDSAKIGLTREEIAKVEEIDLPPLENDARNIWLFSYYFAGVRISDVLRMRWDNFNDGRIWYAMGKNNKGDSLKMPLKAQAILEQYREDNPKHNLVFPDLKGLHNMDDNNAVQKRIKTRVHEINERLGFVANKCGITKKLTNHISRHSFAQNAKDIALPVMQKLLRHTSIITTMGYMSNFTKDDTDNALDAVLNP